MTDSPLISKVYVLRYWITVEDSLPGGDFPIVLPGEFYALTQRLRLNDRLFLQCWNGAPTGRARLVKVIGIQMPPTTPQTVHAPEVTVRVQHTWGWGHDATTDSPKALSWTCEPDEFPVFGRPGHEAVEAPVASALLVADSPPILVTNISFPAVDSPPILVTNTGPTTPIVFPPAAPIPATPDTADQVAALFGL